MSYKGVDIRQSGDRIIVRAFLLDTSNAIVTTGTASLRLYELQSDGTLKSYDFSSNTFKTTALTTETASMTHRTGNNSTTNTGVWSYALTTVSGFTRGNVYLAAVDHSSAVPTRQVREWQYGEGEGDFTVDAAGNGAANLMLYNGTPVNTYANDLQDAAYYASGARSAAESADAAATGAQSAAQAAVNHVVDLKGSGWVTGQSVSAIHAKTALLPAAPAAVGSAMTLAAGAVTAGSVAAGALNGKGDWHTAAQQTADVSSILSAVSNVPGLVWAVSSRTLTSIAQLAGITSLANWLRALARAANNDPTAVSEINAATGAGVGTYDPATDSLQGQTDGGGGGGGTTNVQMDLTEVRA